MAGNIPIAKSPTSLKTLNTPASRTSLKPGDGPNSFRASILANIYSKLPTIFAKPKPERTRDEVSHTIQALKKLELFKSPNTTGQDDTEFFSNIYESIDYEIISQNNALYHYGEPGNKSYIILQGTVDIYAPKSRHEPTSGPIIIQNQHDTMYIHTLEQQKGILKNDKGHAKARSSITLYQNDNNNNPHNVNQRKSIAFKLDKSGLSPTANSPQQQRNSKSIPIANDNNNNNDDISALTKFPDHQALYVNNGISQFRKTASISSGCYFGEASLYSDISRDSTAIASTQVLLLSITKHAYLSAVNHALSKQNSQAELSSLAQIREKTQEDQPTTSKHSRKGGSQSIYVANDEGLTGFDSRSHKQGPSQFPSQRSFGNAGDLSPISVKQDLSTKHINSYNANSPPNSQKEQSSTKHKRVKTLSVQMQTIPNNSNDDNSNPLALKPTTSMPDKAEKIDSGTNTVKTITESATALHKLFNERATPHKHSNKTSTQFSKSSHRIAPLDTSPKQHHNDNSKNFYMNITTSPKFDVYSPESRKELHSRTLQQSTEERLDSQGFPISKTNNAFSPRNNGSDMNFPQFLTIRSGVFSRQGNKEKRNKGKSQNQSHSRFPQLKLKTGHEVSSPKDFSTEEAVSGYLNLASLELSSPFAKKNVSLSLSLNTFTPYNPKAIKQEVRLDNLWAVNTLMQETGGDGFRAEKGSQPFQNNKPLIMSKHNLFRTKPVRAHLALNYNMTNLPVREYGRSKMY